ncbi:unnamed protein product [Paramecium sonneborni]|uniref:Ubiquitin-like protease family profile domain-containing protein n=1 Tax=Paramecium sonneborni TaxID=65129 RepID=A0A8S1M5G6_9CILI|nr:unnamed protein product [Paramecium sonneborni]
MQNCFPFTNNKFCSLNQTSLNVKRVQNNKIEGEIKSKTLSEQQNLIDKEHYPISKKIQSNFNYQNSYYSQQTMYFEEQICKGKSDISQIENYNSDLRDQKQYLNKKARILFKLRLKMKKIIKKQINNDLFYKEEKQYFNVQFKLNQQQQQEDNILRLFQQHGFQYIRISNKYDCLFWHHNILFYCQSKDLISSHQFQNYLLQIKGKLYNVEYDKNKNPKFRIQDGMFDVNLYQKKFILNGLGTEFMGQSNNIKHQGYFLFGQFQQKIEKQEIKLSTIVKKKIIIRDVETQQIINSKIYVNDKSQQNNQNKIFWCKYNQMFNENDCQILNQKLWLSSSIIDSFVFFLNQQNEQRYFTLKQDDRNKVSKILFIPTYVTTSFGSNYNYEKSQTIFQKEILQFQDLEFNLSQIYDQIGFPINRNNNHWYFLLFNLKENNISYYDSLSTAILDNYLLSTLSKLLKFTQKLNFKIEEQFQQQRDGYSCGYRICSLMEHFSEKQFNPQIYYSYNETRLTKLLQEVIREIE